MLKKKSCEEPSASSGFVFDTLVSEVEHKVMQPQLEIIILSHKQLKWNCNQQSKTSAKKATGEFCRCLNSLLAALEKCAVDSL